MKAPIAKHVVYAEAKTEQNPNFVNVWFLDDEAKTWLQNTVPQYAEERIISGEGFYGLRGKDPTPGKAWFVVNKCFDVHEVVDFLNSYKAKS